jgi:hypothetical protein
LANTDDGSCIPKVFGCTDPAAFNYNPLANTDDGSCIPKVFGCTDPAAFNYNPLANTDDGSCIPNCAYPYFSGFLNPENKYTTAGLYDWDCILFSSGVNETSIGAPYWERTNGLVDGHYVAIATGEDYGIVVEATGGYAYKLGQEGPLWSIIDYTPIKIFSDTKASLVINPAACNATGEYIFVELSNRAVPCPAKVYGCTDPYASNYDPLANTDDGSCIYL